MKPRSNLLASLALVLGLTQTPVQDVMSKEDPNAGAVFDTAGVQNRVGKVTKIRVSDGETRFQIDSCAANVLVPAFFVVSSGNPDKLDITRLLIAAMTFDREVKVYNADFGSDINYCPGTGLAAGNITIGTVRVQ